MKASEILQEIFRLNGITTEHYNWLMREVKELEKERKELKEKVDALDFAFNYRYKSNLDQQIDNIFQIDASIYGYDSGTTGNWELESVEELLKFYREQKEE